MGEDLMTSLSIDNYQLSTFLSMDSLAAATSHEESDKDMNREIVISRPPDINLPLYVERSPPPPPPPQSWNHDVFDIMEVGLGHQINECYELLDLPKVGRKCDKRLDSIWGAWFFFTFYFKPVLKEKSKCKVVRDSNGVSGFDRCDLQLDVFLVQHDMENMYMWVFKERPENALGGMQLRSYMNGGHSKQGERSFPFSVDKGFMCSHKMQRKHYRGLSNPVCLHGIELVPSPNLSCIDDEEQKKWMELTGRDLNFSIPPEARDFSSWRNLPNTDFELQRPISLPKSSSHLPSKRLLDSTSLNLSTRPSNHVNNNGLELSSDCGKKRKDFFSHGSDEDCSLSTNPSLNRHQDGEPHTIAPPWMNEFSGVMKNVYGPAAAAKVIYEDSEGYVIMITLPFVDREKVKVHWWNNIDHAIIKITFVSTACPPFVLRNGRTFKLTDPSPEHCPCGDFTREISLPTRIPDDAKLEAYFDKSGAVLELKVPKYGTTPEVHEVPVCLRPPNEFMLS